MKISELPPEIRSQLEQRPEIKLDSPTGPSFGEVLKDSLESLQNLQAEAAHQQSLLALGEADSIHEVVLATEKAGLAMELTLAIRNKLLESYQTLMNTPV
jgi:flagellar hook-basal body complex protein FliE